MGTQVHAYWQSAGGLFLQWKNITSMHLSLLPYNELENLQTSSGNDLGEKNTAKYNTGVIPGAQGGRARWVAGGAGVPEGPGVLEVWRVWRVPVGGGHGGWGGHGEIPFWMALQEGG